MTMLYDDLKYNAISKFLFPNLFCYTGEQGPWEKTYDHLQSKGIIPRKKIMFFYISVFCLVIDFEIFSLRRHNGNSSLW